MSSRISRVNVAAAFAPLLVASCLQTRLPPVNQDRTDAGASCGLALKPCCASSMCGSGLICESGTCQQQRMGVFGQPCSRNSDCGSSGTCLPLGGDAGNVCTESCSNTVSCVPGWDCASFPGAGDICQCTPKTQTCDGMDDGCTGIVDAEPAADNWCAQHFDGGYSCVGSTCVTPMCHTSADCLAGQMCDPTTLQCVENVFTDAGPFDSGFPPFDAGFPFDAGSGMCSTKYDCAIGQICVGGTCSAPTSDQCSQNSMCPRGSICSGVGSCVSGCAESADCPSPLICDATKSTCLTCGESNPCPVNQICVGGGAAAACEAAPSCTTSTSCNQTVAGSVCIADICSNCSANTDCDTAPYGTTDVCDPTVGLCRSSTCNASDCRGVTCNSGQICQRSTCTCASPQVDAGPSCTFDDCNGLQCQTGQECNQQNCTCVTAPSDAGPSCTALNCNGVPCSVGQQCNQSLCECVNETADAGPPVDGGTIAPGAPGSTCTTNADCMFANGECVALLSLGSFCTNACNTAAQCTGGAQCCSVILVGTGTYCDYGELAILAGIGGTCM